MKSKIAIGIAFIIASVLTLLVINGTAYQMCNGNMKLFILISSGAEIYNILFVLFLFKRALRRRNGQED